MASDGALCVSVLTGHRLPDADLGHDFYVIQR